MKKGAILQSPTNLRVRNNHKLFSDYYLDSVLPSDSSLWVETPILDEVFVQIDRLYRKYKQELDAMSEAQLERDFIQPIFQLLGFVFEVQPSVPTPDGTKKPDYAFFESEKRKSEARKYSGEKKFFQNALAIGDAKKWSTDLDRKSEKRKDIFSSLNPSFQIDYYLRSTGKSWGILTNGRIWRLYHSDSSYSLDSFYQINLEELLKTRDIYDLRYFYLFFRMEALLPLIDGICFLDCVRRGSRFFTKAVEEDLKGRAYDTLAKIMRGFVAHRSNQLDPEKNKLEIKENALVLLYRLLFILFAESNRLLPVENATYSEKYSLENISNKAFERMHKDNGLNENTTEYWEYLQRLFELINEGHTDPPIPEYNGGLFDLSARPFLNKNKIADHHLAEIIKELTISQLKGQEVRVVYRDLGVQHLGSVYEGLLEYQPVSKNGQIELESDKGERKATGSYYTPDYIVRFIVENALGPLTNGKDYKFILGLKVLDPAMGSGHFLVGAVDYLAEQIVYHPDTELMAEGVDEKEIQYWRRRVVESCIYGVDLNPMAVELAKLSLWIHTVAKDEALSFLDHHIRCGNSLLGVKIGDLSQLPAIRKEGKKAEAMRKTQIPLYEPVFIQQAKLAIEHNQLISATESHTAADVHKKAELYRSAQEHLQLFRKAANVWLSSFFKIKLNGDEYQHVLDGLSDKKMEVEKSKPFYKSSQELAENKKFFHWEIEFPEIFRNEFGQGRQAETGFDSIIGNPPYDVLKRSKEKINQNAEIDFFRQSIEYSRASGQVLNLFRLFVLRSLSILKYNGTFSCIIPLSVVADVSARGLRQCLLFDNRIIDIQAFPQKDDPKNRVFPEAKLSTCIVTVLKTQIDQSFSIKVHAGKEISDKSPEIVLNPLDITRFDKINLSIPLLTQPEWQVIKKVISKASIGTFIDVVECLVGEIDLSLNRPCITTNPVDASMLKGAQVGRYEIRNLPKQGTKEWINIAKYEKLFGNSPKYQHVREARIIIQGITGTDDKRRLKASIVKENVFLGNSVNYLAFRNKQGYNKYFFLALLNSNFLDWRFRLTSTNNNINNYEIDSLPFPTIDFQKTRTKEEFQEMKDLFESGSVEQLLKSLMETAKIQTVLSHDVLSFLASKMVLTRQKLIKECELFVQWIEDYLKTDVETFSGKKVVKNFVDTNFEKYIEILKVNRSKIGRDLDRREVSERLRREFEKSSSTWQPVKEELKKTDWLIDQIVYELYGLTPKEISVIEVNN